MTIDITARRIRMNKKEIHEYENIMLESYSNLVSYYEETKQLYEKIINEYANEVVPEVAICSKIATKNTMWVIIKLILETLDGIKLYTSDKCGPNKTTVIDLTTLKIESGTKLRLKADVVGGYTWIADTIIDYNASSTGTALFVFEGSTVNRELNFAGIILPVSEKANVEILNEDSI